MIDGKRSKTAQKDYIVQRRNSIKASGVKNSEILSDRVRLISLAVLGTCWALVVGKISPSTENSAYELSTARLLWPMALSVAALLSDLLQYILYQFSINVYLRKTRVFNSDKQSRLYLALQKDQDWKPVASEWLNIFAEWMYVAKLLCAVAGAAIFLVFVFIAFY